MDIKDILAKIDGLDKAPEPRVIVESTNKLAQRMEEILKESQDLDEKKISFKHTGKKSSLKKHLKQSHGLKKSVKRSSSHGAKRFLKDEMNPEDTVTMDIPLLIRLLEYAREDSQDDMDLHNVAEKLIQLSEDGKTLTMDNYESIVGGESEEPSNEREI